MLLLTVVDALLALALGLWLRAMLRARAGEVPCTRRAVSWRGLLFGLTGMVGVVVANVLVLQLFDARFERTLAPERFALWLLAQCAAGILWIIALTTWDLDRYAELWLRVAGPRSLFVREGQRTTELTLTPGCVNLSGLVQGPGGAFLALYVLRVGDLRLALQVPLGLRAKVPTEGLPFFAAAEGLLVQGDGKALHELFVPLLDVRGPDAGPQGPG